MTHKLILILGILLAVSLVRADLASDLLALGEDMPIRILNVQSYPVVGGSWITNFQTLGEADLKITPFNSTLFEKDLEFTSLKCGDRIVEPTELTDLYVKFDNYYCFSESHFEVKVLSSGVHTLRFEFGREVDYSYNEAGEWWHSSWTKCKNITITNTGGSTLTNFPAYVNVTKDNDMQTDYDDLRFVNTSCDNGGSELAYELENYTAANAHTWVKVNLSAGNNIISVYYGNAGASAGENPTAVWDANYKMVHHFAETSGSYVDSTSNENNATTVNVVTRQASGKIGIAPEFDGTVGDYLAVPYKSSLDLAGGNLTFEIWLNGDDVTAEQCLISKNSLGTGQGWNSELYDARDFMLQSGEGSTAMDMTTGDSLASNNIWYYVVVIWDTTANDAIFYTDSAVQSHNGAHDDMADWDARTVDTCIGLSCAGGIDGALNYPFDGEIDEVRLSNVVRSSDWVNQSYQLVINQGTYVVFGTEETIPSDITPPTYSDNSTNSTTAGASILHSLNWSDETGLSGYIFSFDDNATFGYTYQETADETGCSNAVCDGNWSSYATVIIQDFNYTKPTNVQSSSLWQVKDGDGIVNLTIPSDCWDYLPNKLWLGIYTDYISTYKWRCHNSSGWHDLRQSSSQNFYEEAMWWNTSIWVNDTFVSMTGTGNWSNVTKTITSEVGVNVSWCIYANDTSDNWNSTSCDSPFSYVTTSAAPEDTCTCPASGNWNIQCSDNCDIQACNMKTNNVLINGTGTAKSLRNITNATRIRLQGGCVVRW